VPGPRSRCRRRDRALCGLHDAQHIGIGQDRAPPPSSMSRRPLEARRKVSRLVMRCRASRPAPARRAAPARALVDGELDALSQQRLSRQCRRSCTLNRHDRLRAKRRRSSACDALCVADRRCASSDRARRLRPLFDRHRFCCRARRPGAARELPRLVDRPPVS